MVELAYECQKLLAARAQSQRFRGVLLEILENARARGDGEVDIAIYARHVRADRNQVLNFVVAGEKAEDSAGGGEMLFIDDILANAADALENVDGGEMT